MMYIIRHVYNAQKNAKFTAQQPRNLFEEIKIANLPIRFWYFYFINCQTTMCSPLAPKANATAMNFWKAKE